MGIPRQSRKWGGTLQRLLSSTWREVIMGRFDFFLIKAISDEHIETGSSVFDPD